MINLCNSRLNANDLHKAGRERESVDLDGHRNKGQKYYPPVSTSKSRSTGNMLVGFQPQWLIARRYCGTSKAQTPRTNPIFGWEAASKAVSMIGTPLASTDLYPVQITGGEFLNLD